MISADASKPLRNRRNFVEHALEIEMMGQYYIGRSVFGNAMSIVAGFRSSTFPLFLARL